MSLRTRRAALVMCCSVVALLALPGVLAARTSEERIALLSAQLERAVERLAAAEPTPEAELAFLRSTQAMRSLFPANVPARQPGLRRLLREWYAQRLGPRSAASTAVWDALLPGGTAVPLAVLASDTLRSRNEQLLDAALLQSSALGRGDDGLVLELLALDSGDRVTTVATSAVLSEYAGTPRRVINPEYLRRQTELIEAQHDLASAEADDRADPGLMSALSVLVFDISESHARRAIEHTPTTLLEPVYWPYEPRRTEATARCSVQAVARLCDPATGRCDTLTLAGAAEHMAYGLSGVREGDRNGHYNCDAAAALPALDDRRRVAWDDLRTRAATPVARAAGHAAARHAALAARAGQGADALGWWLLARDCGADVPVRLQLDRRVAAALALEPSQLLQLRLAPLR